MGKGGVGKTTITTALGILASQVGKRVLLIELDTEGSIPPLFDEAPIFDEPKEIWPNLFALTIQPQSALHEYVLLKLKFETLYKLIFENRIIKFFRNAVPGLNEILMMGKIWFLNKQHLEDGSPLFDLIIVDSPATGHGLSFLQVPKTVRKIVRLGPINEDAKKIEALVYDSSKCGICLVTLPEEMPTNEAIEFQQQLHHALQLPIHVVIANKVIPDFFTHEELSRLQEIKQKGGNPILKDLNDSAQFLRSRHLLNQRYLDRLSKAFKDILISLPYLFTEDMSTSHLIQLSNLLQERGS